MATRGPPGQPIARSVLQAMSVGALLLTLGALALLLGWVGGLQAEFSLVTVVLAFVALILYVVGWGFLYASQPSRSFWERFLFSGFGPLLLGLVTLPTLLQPLEGGRDVYLWQLFLFLPLFLYIPWIAGAVAAVHGYLFLANARRLVGRADAALLGASGVLLLVLGSLGVVLVFAPRQLFLPLFLTPLWGLAGSTVVGYALASFAAFRNLKAHPKWNPV
ncbi:MAG: hypothetical protein V3U30_00600 [Thermoplasmata archaeon]